MKIVGLDWRNSGKLLFYTERRSLEFHPNPAMPPPTPTPTTPTPTLGPTHRKIVHMIASSSSHHTPDAHGERSRNKFRVRKLVWDWDDHPFPLLLLLVSLELLLLLLYPNGLHQQSTELYRFVNISINGMCHSHTHPFPSHSHSGWQFIYP